MEAFKLFYKCRCNYNWIEVKTVIIDDECEVCGEVSSPKKIIILHKTS